MKKITVFGSFVVDLMARTDTLPTPGETVKGNLFRLGPGGKGFNQCVAAHKAGANVTMVTKLGKDTFARVAVDTMEQLGMDTSCLLETDSTETGVALILVDEKTSQNEIVVVPGACETIDKEDMAQVEKTIAGADYLLTQLETNLDAVEWAVDIASRNDVKVILNTAPAQPISDQLLAKVDLVTPNEVEAQLLTGVCVDSEDSARQAAQCFFKKGVRQVIITLGSRGVYVDTQDKRGIIPPYRVDAVDTTGAGDAFNGGLVCALAEGKGIWEAAQFANGVAALSVTRLGTTPAMPTRQEIDAFIDGQGE